MQGHLKPLLYVKVQEPTVTRIISGRQGKVVSSMLEDILEGILEAG
jgi:hypothetical protein